MTQFFTGDFADFSTCSGGTCGDWVEQIKTGRSWSVTSGVLSVPAGGTNDWNALSWTDAGSPTDVEVLQRFTTGTTPVFGGLLRGAGSDESTAGFAWGFTSGQIRIYYVVSDNANLISGTAFSYANSTEYWIRFRLNGTSPTTVQAKVWSGAIGDEPASWTINTTTSSGPQTSGWVGIAQSGASNTYTVTLFGVGTGGDTAPDSSGGGGSQTISVTHSSETEAAQAISVIAGAVTVSVGHAAETDAAQLITPVQAAVVALGHAVETDSAQSIAVLSSITVSVSHAVESDTAQTIAPVLSSTVSVGHASETDTAQSIAAIVSGANSVGHASETDTAQTITPVPGAVTVSIGAATETSSAQAIAALASLAVSLGTATEVGTVGAITPVPGGVIVSLNAASETDSAQQITVFVPGVMTLTSDDIAAIWGYELESGLSAKEAIRLILAVLVGKTDITALGGGAAIVKFRDINDTKDRVTAIMAGSERTSTTLDAT